MTSPTALTPVLENTTSGDPNVYTDAQIYGYGTAAVAIISLFSLVGITLFPGMGRNSHSLALQFFIGLGIGTMAADALLHIIPSVLGLHEHAEEDGHEEHDHEEEAEETIYVWQLSVVCAGIYVFYLFENGLKTWRRTHPRVGDLSAHIEENHYSSQNSSRTTVCDIESEYNGQIEQSQSKLEKFTVSEPAADDVVCYKFTTTLLTVFVGDVLHNFADGLAIGVSFASSWTTGVGTSLAVLCHEIPHEFGDFAIYLKNGATKWRAIGLNFAAACCAFIGLYSGIALGQEEAIRSWLLAVIAGMFLYIALVQVMGEMLREVASNPLLQFILQNLGLLLGWAIMLLMALYEEDIEASITG